VSKILVELGNNGLIKSQYHSILSLGNLGCFSHHIRQTSNRMIKILINLMKSLELRKTRVDDPQYTSMNWIISRRTKRRPSLKFGPSCDKAPLRFDKKNRERNPTELTTQSTLTFKKYATTTKNCYPNVVPTNTQS